MTGKDKGTGEKPEGNGAGQRPAQPNPWAGRPKGGASGGNVAKVEYAADERTLFRMTWRMTGYTMATVGIYRFWLRTALRRHYWSAIRIEGDPMEYTGRGLEKLLGFLLALVILAVFLGLLNLGLTFVGFSLASDDPLQVEAAFQLSVLATLPLLAYARYRGLRYMLARTRWRGIRFGLEPGAWGYVWRATLLTLLTIVTLGLAYPYQHFKLAKYMTDRTRFGDMKFQQGGSWKALIPSWALVYLTLIVIGAVIWLATLALPLEKYNSWIEQNSREGTLVAVFTGVATLAILAVFYHAALRYRFAAFRILWSHKTLQGKSPADEVRFGSDLNAIKMAFVYLGYALLIGIAAAAWIIGGVFLSGLAEVIAHGVAATAIFFLPTIAAMAQVLLTHRILRRLAGSLAISNPQALALSAQRAHDKAAEAGGFADALDVDPGAGF